MKKHRKCNELTSVFIVPPEIVQFTQIENQFMKNNSPASTIESDDRPKHMTSDVNAFEHFKLIVCCLVQLTTCVETSKLGHKELQPPCACARKQQQINYIINYYANEKLVPVPYTLILHGHNGTSSAERIRTILFRSV